MQILAQQRGLRLGGRRLYTARGFTLIELLVSVMIVGVLVTIFLGALASAEGRSRVIRTESVVNKLHGTMLLRYETYATRRLPIDPRLNITAASVFQGVSSPSADNNRHLALVRLLALRELMRMELPDRYTDLHSTIFDPVALRISSTVPYRPALWYAYRQRIATARGIALSGVDAEIASATGVAAQHQGAECLYMVVTMACEDQGLGGDQLYLPDIGDVDGDGMLEFIDAWGRPVHWYRWAPGFISERQPYFSALSDPRDSANHHDMFDVANVDWPLINPGGMTDPESPSAVGMNARPRGFALMPLIVSEGPDGELGLLRGSSPNTSGTGGLDSDPYTLHMHVSGTSEPRLGRGAQLDRDTLQVLGWSSTAAGNVGTPAHFDNIHNHILGTR